MIKIGRIFKQLRVWGFRGVMSALRRLPYERLMAARLLLNARRNRGTSPVPGITIVAPMSGAYSLSKTMRDFALRLREAGVPLQVFDTFCGSPRAKREDYESLLTSSKDFNLLKYDWTVEMLTSPLPPGLGPKRARIAFWEAESKLLDVFPYLADSDAVIAMSDFNAQYFAREMPSGVSVKKILYPLMPTPADCADKSQARKMFGLAQDAFIVFFNFDVSAEYRKNAEGVLLAFAKALRDCEKAKLVFKVNGARRHPEKFKRLQETAERLGIAQKLLMITEYLTERDLYSLTNACDVYVSLHRAEGFGLGIAEAMSLGKAVIATDYSATTEFCRPGTALLVPFKMVSNDEQGFAGRIGDSWAEPDVDAAARALRCLYDNPQLRNDLGNRAKAFICDYFSIENFRRSVESFLGVSEP